MLTIYNSLSRKKEVFKPITPGKIKLYVCGITVYDSSHLGHARSMVCFDFIVRYLRSQGYDVTYVKNITDIDDKIINRAVERGISISELTSYYIDLMHKDMDDLNVILPDIEPRATQYIPQMIHLIERLIDAGKAYLSNSGDVCFEVSSFKDYGKLSNKDLDSLQAGARIEIDKDKHSPLDFVLWKRSREGEPSWDSPWGPGRPGWHIECSAMAMDTLGDTFDIHGGGLDLQFPHHENEIAQSEAATHKHLANYWMHHGLLQINNEKMAKSLGNFFTIADVLQKYQHEAVRYFLLSSHYRSPLNYSEENLLNAEKALTRLYQSLKGIEFNDEPVDETWERRFVESMNDDFNTPVALSVLFDLSHELNKSKSPQLAKTLKSLAEILGLLQNDPESFLQMGQKDLDKEKIEALITERLEARTNRNWAKADEIRAQLLSMGVELEDGPNGTTWRLQVGS